VDNLWTAEISPCGRYRYRLGRSLPEGDESQLLWIMLNPSTADAQLDDPTIRKCRGFTQRLGFGKFSVGNLFAFRATDPKSLLKVAASDYEGAIGPDNDKHLIEMIQAADAVLFAWGAHGRRFSDRCTAVQQMASKSKAGWLGDLSKEGCPRHPLMLAYDTKVVWR